MIVQNAILIRKQWCWILRCENCYKHTIDVASTVSFPLDSTSNSVIQFLPYLLDHCATVLEESSYFSAATNSDKKKFSKLITCAVITAGTTAQSHLASPLRTRDDQRIKACKACVVNNEKQWKTVLRKLKL